MEFKEEVYLLKVEDGLSDLLICDANDADKISELESKGYVRAILESPPQKKEGYKCKENFVIEDGYMYQKWDYVVDTESIMNEIEQLKSNLDESDYKVIKCFEAQLTASDMPYDINQLHEERQTIRDKINMLEGKLQLQ